MEDYENKEEDIDICEDTEGEEDGDAENGIANAAADGWNKIGDKKEQAQLLEKPPFCPGPLDRMEGRLQNLLERVGTVSGEVQFSKAGQEKVELKNGFNYTQNTDGSMVVRDTAGNQFIVAADNTLTVVRPGGQVETYQPRESRYKDGGSIGYGYPEEAGFHLVRKHRGIGRNPDTGVEITTPTGSLSTVSQPGRVATFSYEPTAQKQRIDNLKKVAS